MKSFKLVQQNLRTKMLAAFSVLLFISFGAISLGFNIAVNQYIQSSAKAMLHEAGTTFSQSFDFPPTEPITVLGIGGGRPSIFRTNLRIFIMDEAYHIVNSVLSDYAAEIAEFLRIEGISPYGIQNIRLRVNEQVFYVSSGMVGENGGYIVYYVDISDLQYFIRTINVFLLYLAGIIWLVAVVVTGFLANSLTRPLFILRDFAKRIGLGDFTPNPISFSNEEFEALNQSLNHTAKQLNKYDNDQKIFFQNVSHELRTPLMTIESYAEGIKHGIMDPEKASTTIIEASGRLTDLVDDILYISRIDNITTPKMEKIDLNSLIWERIRHHSPLAENKGISIHYETGGSPIIVTCVASYVGRAIDNLISNAIRYAVEVITIECRTNWNQAIISVSDDGPGFEPEVIPFVFERFVKGKNGLTGIGLSVVRSIVEQHKGIATAENKDVGAKLTICIPRGI